MGWLTDYWQVDCQDLMAAHHSLFCGCMLVLGLCLTSRATEVSREWVAAHAERMDVLIAQLDPATPGLEALAGDDRYAALQAVVAYYRQKSWPEPLVDQLLMPSGNQSAENRRIADDLLEDVFTLQGITAKQPRLAGGGLDWYHGGPKDDKEWSWFLNRHRYLLNLLDAHATTGDRRYIQVVDALLHDWVLANPFPDRFNLTAPWRALETARRIDRSWLETMIALRNHPDFRPETFLLMLSSLPDHAVNLMQYPTPSGNHRLTEHAMLGKLAVFFPEFRDAPLWKRVATDVVLELALEQNYPDGSYKELANHYQLVALRSFQQLYNLLSVTEKDADALRLRPHLEKMWSYVVGVMRPNLSGPLNNDSDLDPNGKRVAEAASYFDRDDWRTYLDGTSEEAQPSRFYPWAGHAVMRDSWRPDARWAFFDLGPLGTAHEHADRLHLSISLGQQDFLVDKGRYTYVRGPLRDYFRGPRGHNLVLLNGKGSQVPPREVTTPMEVVHAISPHRELYGGSVAFRGPVSGEGYHTRYVWFFRNTGWIVIDEVVAFGPYELTTLWHFHPDISVMAEASGLVASAPDGQTLYLIHDRIVGHAVSDGAYELRRGQATPEYAGWYSAQFNERLPAWEARYRERISGPITKAWLIADSRSNLIRLHHQLHSVDLPQPLLGKSHAVLKATGFAESTSQNAMDP